MTRWPEMFDSDRGCDEGGEAPCYAHLFEDPEATEEVTEPAEADSTVPSDG
jgi:hypothetical protein